MSPVEAGDDVVQAALTALLARLTELKIEGKAVLPWMSTNLKHQVKDAQALKLDEIQKLQGIADKIQPTQEKK